MAWTTWTLMLLLTGLPALAQEHDLPSSPDSAQAAAAVESRMEAWLDAYERGDVEALAQLFTKRGIYAANTGQLLRGQTDIAEGVRGWIAARPQILTGWGLDDSAGLDVQTITLRFRSVDDLAYTLQRFVVRVEPPGCAMDAGHLLAAWRRQDTGEWLFETLIVNQDREPPANACARRQSAAAGAAAGAQARVQSQGMSAIEAALRELQADTGEPDDARPIVAIRTPDDRFGDLPGYPFAPHYATVDGLRIHYVDEGPRDAAPVVLLHGEPSWSFLYRKMIPVLVAAGHRVIAPDLVGFGRSDKPVNRSTYSAARHVTWMRSLLLDELRLDGITLFGQDWGGIIGLHLVAEEPDRVACVVAANTGLPTGDPPPGVQRDPSAFLEWRRFSQEAAELPVGAIVQLATVSTLPPEVVAAYDAPFPDERYKAGARVFPMLVPITPDHPGSAGARAAWATLSRWEKPFLTLFSDGDPITRGGDRVFQERIPGARGQPHRIIGGAGHFLQEDAGEEIARLVNGFIERNGCGGRSRGGL